MRYKFLLLSVALLLFVSISVLAEETGKFLYNQETIDEVLKVNVPVLPVKYNSVKVTLSEKSIPMKDLLPKLSKETGINMVPDKDARVEDRRMRIFADDANISSVMCSIADVTKFTWVAKDENTYVLTFNDNVKQLLLPLEVNCKKESQKYIEAKREVWVNDLIFDIDTDRDAKKRKDLLNNLITYKGIRDTAEKRKVLSDDLIYRDINSEREVWDDDLIIYSSAGPYVNLKKLWGISDVKTYNVKSGEAEAFRYLLATVPGLREAIIKRKSKSIKVKDLDEKAKEYFCFEFSQNEAWLEDNGRGSRFSFTDDNAVINLDYGYPEYTRNNRNGSSRLDLKSRLFFDCNYLGVLYIDKRHTNGNNYYKPTPQDQFYSIYIPNPGDKNIKRSITNLNYISLSPNMGIFSRTDIPANMVYHEMSNNYYSKLPVPYLPEFSRKINLKSLYRGFVISPLPSNMANLEGTSELFNIQMFDDIPDLSRRINLEKPPVGFLETLRLFSKATSSPVFCDDYGNVPLHIEPYSYILDIESENILLEGSLYDVLYSICRTFNLNVSYKDGNFNFSNIWWFKYANSADPVDLNLIFLGENDSERINNLINLGRYTAYNIYDANNYLNNFYNSLDMNYLRDELVRNIDILNSLYRLDSKSRENFANGNQVPVSFRGAEKLLKYLPGERGCYYFIISSLDNKEESIIHFFTSPQDIMHLDIN